MKRLLAAVVAAVFPLPAHAAGLPLKRVVLSTSGLAQYTHSGRAEAGSSIELTVRLDQVDDLLKSLTVFDQQGALGPVSLPGKAPLTELFRDLPFGPEALNSPTALLNALIGTEIEIEGPISARGRVFRIEDERVELPDQKGATMRHRLTLQTPKGLVQALLEDLTALRFADAQARDQLDQALAGLAKNRARDRRTLSISLLGQGARDVGFSYVAAAPVWKSAYRLVLPKEGGKARLQGWGVIENLTGSDWKDVELSLISGNPVALKQQLYTAFFADRPEAPVNVSQRLTPSLDDEEPPKPKFGDGANAASKAARPKAEKPVLPNTGLANPTAGLGAVGGYSRLAEEMAREDPASPALIADAEEASTQVLYKFPAKLSLASGSSMMIPFVDREIAATRTWLYQPETDLRRPLAAVRLKNDSEAALPAGVVTAFDMGADGAANFAGDSQLPLLAKGGQKYVSFALDARTDVRRLDRGVTRVRLGKAVNGQLTATVRSQWKIEYEITPPQDDDREIVIDETRSAIWKPVGDLKDLEETPTRLRYKVAAPKGRTTRASLTLENTESESIALASQAPEQMLVTINRLENESPQLKSAVEKLGALVQDVNGIAGRRKELDAENKKIVEDQERLRRNLTTVGANSDLGRRYLDALKEQEDRLAAIASEDRALEAETVAKRKAAEDLARSLTL